MKLLSKSAVDAAKALEQKRTIDEGMKLAQRVDNLREVAAEEEVSLENFRRKSVENINKEITEKTGDRDSLKREVEEYEKRRRDALKPINEELEAVYMARKKLESLRQENDDKHRSLEIAARFIDAQKADASRILERARTKEELCEKQLSAAEVARRNAIQTQKDTEQLRKVAQDESVRIRDDLFHREEGVSLRESNVILKESEIISREQELFVKNALLEDREATFERNYTRARDVLIRAESTQKESAAALQHLKTEQKRHAGESLRLNSLSTDLSNREKKVMESEKKISESLREIRDKYMTLENTSKRTSTASSVEERNY